MARYSDTLVNQLGVPIAGALVSVVSSETGVPAVLTTDTGASLNNPFLTDASGNYVFDATDDYYDLTYRYGGRIILEERNVLVGTPSSGPSYVDNTIGTSTTRAPSQAAVKAALAAIPIFTPPSGQLAQ